MAETTSRFFHRHNPYTPLRQTGPASARRLHALPQIIRNLADSGIPIKRLEVVLADQTEPQTFKDQSLQDGSFQQQGSSEGDNFGNTATNSEWMTNINSYQDFSEQQDMFVTDKSINMLV